MSKQYYNNNRVIISLHFLYSQMSVGIVHEPDHRQAKCLCFFFLTNTLAHLHIVQAFHSQCGFRNLEQKHAEWCQRVILKPPPHEEVLGKLCLCKSPNCTIHSHWIVHLTVQPHEGSCKWTVLWGRTSTYPDFQTIAMDAETTCITNFAVKTQRLRLALGERNQ